MTNENSSANRITIDVRALRHNYRLISASVPDAVEVMAMVKGDGYGHGMIEAARAFAAAGCRVFGVAELCEGVRLRRSGIEGDIYVMVGFLPEQVEVFFSHDLTPVVYSRQIIELVSAAAVRLNRSIGLHLKIDTGMGRLGVLPDEIEAFAALIEKLPNVYLAGVLSHFAQADNAQSPETGKAFAAFTAACDRLAGRFSGLRHIANSGAVLNFPETLGNMVRAGYRPLRLFAGRQPRRRVGRERVPPPRHAVCNPNRHGENGAGRNRHQLRPYVRHHPVDPAGRVAGGLRRRLSARPLQ